jgi:hypothetical protein
LYGTNQALHADLECISCYLAKCPFTTTCMDALTPRAIWLQLGESGLASARSGVFAISG